MKPRLLLIACCLVVFPTLVIKASSAVFSPAALAAEPGVESTQLPGAFHRDPADRLSVALARQLGAESVTADRGILSYGEVRTLAAG